MHSSQFVVGESGLLSEAAAIEQARWYATMVPDLDPLAVEAHVMLASACAAVSEEPVFDRGDGLSSARYNVLRVLYSADNHRRLMSEIVAGVQASAANVSKLVTSLERDGYVRRSANDSDKRRVWVELLPAGVTAVERALPRVARHIAGIWQGLSRDEKRVLVHLLAKLRLDICTRSAERHVGDVSIT